MTQRAWRSEIAWTLALIGVILGLGAAMDALLPTLCVVLFYLLLRNYFYLFHLYRWSKQPKRNDLPDAAGIWGEVYVRLMDMHASNRKRKKRLAEILSAFQASTAALPDGAVVLTQSGQIAWFNTAAQALLGLRSPQDVGLRIANLIRHPKFTAYIAAGEYETAVEAISPVNPAILLSMRIIPYGDRQRLMIVRDISEFRRVENARRDFVSNASHELRTPLTVMRGYLDMMAADCDDGGPLAPWRKPLLEMQQQSTRMEALVADMLKLARLEADVLHKRPQLVDVPRVLQAALESSRQLSAGRHRIDADIDADLCLYGRETEVQSVVENLLANAVHYTPDGGEIRLSWAANEAGAQLQVSDTGIGISDADLGRLTERFYRVDVDRSRDRGGTGLGLAIVKYALEHHEARLQVDSTIGEGSRFICQFPPQRVHRGRTLRSQAGKAL